MIPFEMLKTATSAKDVRLVVNHYNTFPYGGAANAALRLHREMRNQSVASRFLVARSDRSINNETGLHQLQWAGHHQDGRRWWPSLFEKQRIRRIRWLYDTHLAARSPELEVFSMPQLVERTVHNRPDFVSGIVHLHWIAFMADYPSFFGSLPTDTPIVWTLHDMNPLTGGCHYSDGCRRFVDGCGHCPQVAGAGAADVSSIGMRIKRRSLKSHKLTVVSPSLWLKRLAENSPVFPRTTTFHHIRLGFDLDRLHPIPKRAARAAIGIDTDRILIGFGAESIENRRKGFDLLRRALSQLKSQRLAIECVVIGDGEIADQGLDLPLVHKLGYVREESRIAQFYSACDLVVVPSRQDNQPQAALEAMACGTPVVAFDVGGIGEFIKPGVTGWLAQPEDARDLAEQMRKLIVDADARANLSARCRQLMLQEFDIVKQTRKYIDLYRRLDRERRAARVA